MSVALDNRQQQFGAGAFAPAELPQMRFYSSAPQFTNPWQQQQQQQQQHLQTASQPPASYTAAADDAIAPGHVRHNSQAHRLHGSTSVGFQQPAPPTLSIPSGTYSAAGSLPGSATSTHVDSPLQGFMTGSNGPLTRFSHDYSSDTHSNTNSHMYGQLPMKPDTEGLYPGQPQIRNDSFASLAGRRASHPLHSASDAQRSSFSDALDASRGMIAMSQQDITPRNIFDVQRASRGSVDSYGFPAPHSAHSSFSSASGYPPMYYGSSVSEASYGDYSSANESVSGRSSYSSNSYMAPNPIHHPAGSAAMMGHFSAKVNSSTQKKHKCKICDKRFTRPSSLQTHMYSHTGEKPFACEVEGCGRQFSVVSNLRRHRKVHRGEGEGEGSTCSDGEE